MTSSKAKNQTLWILLSFLVIFIISFSGCVEDGDDTDTENDDATLSVQQPDEEGGRDEIMDENGERDMSSDETAGDGFRTQEEPLEPPAEPAAGSEDPPPGELVLMVSLSGVDDPIALENGIAVRTAGSMYVQCTVVNSTDAMEIIDFATSQKLDIIINDAEGNTVYKWSDNMRFAQVVTSLELNPGENWSHEITVPIGGDEDRLAPGAYTITVMVTGTPQLLLTASDVVISG